MKINDLVAGALTDFVGFLTTRPTSTAFGAEEEVPKAISLLDEFCSIRGVTSGNAMTQDWDQSMKNIDAAQLLSVEPSRILVPGGRH